MIINNNKLVHRVTLEELDGQTGDRVINKAIKKSRDLMDNYGVGTGENIQVTPNNMKFSFDVVNATILNLLVDVSDSMRDLSNLLSIMASEHLQEYCEVNHVEPQQMSQAKLEQVVDPYIQLQHKFAGFNNTQIREMLLEVSKQVLTSGEFMSSYLGMDKEDK